jgi:hypothetical protein
MKEFTVMPKQDLAEIVCIIDRSGSMDSMRRDAIGGFNAFLNEQKRFPGEARMTLVLFDHEYIVACEGKDLKDVEPLDELSYIPRGRTALLDAIGRTIISVGERLARTLESDRPGKVIVSILTDGEENASTKYTRTQIMELIEHQRRFYTWEFLFLAANQDAIREGATLGIHARDSYRFNFDEEGVSEAFGNLNECVSRLR